MTYLNLIRITQWVKNFMIFVTPLAVGNFKTIFSFESAALFICFSLFISSTYIINDIKDIKSDRLHPQKKNRALASGKISINKAKIIFLIQFSLSLICIFIINLNLLILSLGYLTATLLYSYKLKYIKYLDIFTIAALFILRLYIGSYFYGITVSLDLFVVVLFLSILLVTSKKYSIRNNPMISEGKIKNFLIGNYTNENLLFLYYTSSALSSFGLLYWIYDNKYQKILDLKLFNYIIIFLLYEIFLATLYKLTIKNQTEDFAVLVFRSKFLLATTFLIVLIYVFQLN
jgi:decaprenyl-phosphate phosphoribosyltransferase